MRFIGLPGLAFVWRVIAVVTGICAITMAPALAQLRVAGSGEAPAPAGTIVIEGLETYSLESAEAAIVLQRRFVAANGVTTARADDAAFFLESELRRSGLKNARVEWEVAGDRIVLTVYEGRRMLLGEIVVKGNGHLSGEAVAELATKETRERFSLPTAAPEIPYVLSDILGVPQVVEQFYRRLGFRDVKVHPVSSRERESDQRIDLTIEIEEGRLYRVGEIKLPDLPGGVTDEDYALVAGEFSGRRFTRAVPANLEAKVIGAGREQGYFDVDAVIEESDPRQAEDGVNEWIVDLAVRAEWGRQYTLTGATVTGREKIRKGVIESRYERFFGEPFSPSVINETTTSLLRTGAFESVLVEPIPHEDGTLHLDVTVEEGDRHRVGVFGGADSYLGPIIGLEYRNSNAFGRVHTFDSQIEYSGRGFRGTVGYLNPWFLGSDWELKLDLFSLTRQNEGYKTFETGAGIGFARKFGKRRRHEVTALWRPSYTDVTEFDIERRFLGDETYFNAPVTLGYTYSAVDNEQAPTKGFIFDVALGAAGSWSGSEVEYTRARTRVAYYRPIGKTTLRLGARAGVIWPEDDMSFPIDLRYFSGGASSVRSFRERDLGLRDRNGYPVGGEFFTTFNAEYHIPIRKWLTVAPFFDAGNLLLRSGDAGLDDMHYAGGLSLLFTSPIGPLRIDYGHNLNRGQGEPSGSWHFGFGFAF